MTALPRSNTCAAVQAQSEDTFDLRAPSPLQIAAHTANKRGIIIYRYDEHCIVYLDVLFHA